MHMVNIHRDNRKLYIVRGAKLIQNIRIRCDSTKIKIKISTKYTV